jgi:hypothetical protein
MPGSMQTLSLILLAQSPESLLLFLIRAQRCEILSKRTSSRQKQSQTVYTVAEYQKGRGMLGMTSQRRKDVAFLRLLQRNTDKRQSESRRHIKRLGNRD